MNVRTPPEGDFLAALRREAGATALATRTPATTPARPSAPAGRPGDLPLGAADTGGAIGVRSRPPARGTAARAGRLGRRQILDVTPLARTEFRRIQQIVIDPEGEFASLAQTLGHVVIDASRLDTAALTTAAARVREHRISVLVDLSDCERETQMLAVATILRALVAAPREHWHPALVAIDEAHLFAPFGGDAVALSPSARRRSAH